MCKCGCNTCETKKPALMLNESVAPREILSEGLKYHMDNNRPLTEHLYRAGSQNYFNLWAEARSLYSRQILEITNEDDLAILNETDLGHFGTIYEIEIGDKVKASKEYGGLSGEVIDVKGSFIVVKTKEGTQSYHESDLQVLNKEGIKVPLDFIMEDEYLDLNEGTFESNEIAIYDDPNGDAGETRIYKRGTGYYGENDSFDFEAKDKAELEAKLKRWGYTLQAGSLNEAEIYEGFLKDLVWAVKSDVGNAIMGNSSPGRVLYNKWKSGELYKDEKSPYSKKVSWYDEGAIKTKAQEYDNADKVTGAALKKVSDIKKKFGTKINTEELGKNKEYLTAYIDYLTKEAQSLVKLHEFRLALGMREKSNPYGLSVPIYDAEGNYKGESVDRELLLKKFPKEWVDEMNMDKPIKISSLVGEYNEKIKAAKDQLSKLSESINEAKKKSQKKDPPIGKPMRDTSGGKAYKVYVRDPKTKRIKTVRFGSGGLRAKINDSKARSAFAKRHKCSTRNDRTKASYWSCRLPRYAKLLGLKSNFSGFW